MLMQIGGGGLMVVVVVECGWCFEYIVWSLGGGAAEAGGVWMVT
jgi:hypothetical protein